MQPDPSVVAENLKRLASITIGDFFVVDGEEVRCEIVAESEVGFADRRHTFEWVRRSWLQAAIRGGATVRPKPRVVIIYCSCSSDPSQFEGQLDDGRFIYARFRNNRLTVGIGVTEDEAVDVEPMVDVRRYVDAMSFDQLKYWTEGEIVWPEVLNA